MPYRDSKLTRMLQNALGGSGRAAMVCAVHPGPAEAEEAMSTLRFGEAVSSVSNTVVADIRAKTAAEYEELLGHALFSSRGEPCQLASPRAAHLLAHRPTVTYLPTA